MLEIIKEIIVPIITAILGFFGGITYKSYEYKKEFKSNTITGNNSKMVNGDNNECKNKE